MIVNRTDLAVLKPFRIGKREPFRFTIWHGVALLVALAVAVGIGEAQAQPAGSPVLSPPLSNGRRCWRRASRSTSDQFPRDGDRHRGRRAAWPRPDLALPPVRGGSWFVTQFFRNSPWLVLLFYCMLLLPFEVRIGDISSRCPVAQVHHRASLPVMANVSEFVRGAVRSIPYGQWESAESLAITRWQTLRMVILPQCVKRMTPPWMNLYAILTVATPLTSVVGVSEAMTLTGDILSSEARTELLVPMYLFLLLWFFAYCYPIARATLRARKSLSGAMKVWTPTGRWCR